MSNLGTKIVEDIKAKFNSGDLTNKVVSEAGNIHVKSIRKQSFKEETAYGDGWDDLSEGYAKAKGANVADLYSADIGSGSGHALDSMDSNPVDNEFSIDFATAHQEDYMGAHQRGKRAEGDYKNMPVRQWFPLEKDKNSGPQKKNIEAIEQVLEKYMNEDRTVRVKERVT